MESALALCRFAHFAAAMTLFGGTLYLRALAPPGLAHALRPSARRIAAAAILVAAVSALAWAALEAASMTGEWSGLLDPDALEGVLMDTAFGAVWLWRLAVAALLVAALAIGRHGPSSAVLALSALLLASLGLVGHAAMQTGALGALHRANHAAHLIAAGAWIGGLPPFALGLARYRDPKLRDEVARSILRFSTWGRLGVALIVLTGTANLAMTSGASTFSRLTPYRVLLAVKLALVAAMIALALFNRYALVPRLARRTSALAILVKTSLVELLFGFFVIALVSVLGLLDPY